MKTIMCLKDLSVKSMTCAGFAISLLTASANAFGGSGSGTFADPYQIGTAAQLQEMSEALSAHYVLTTDVDATVTTTWNGGAGFMPVGSVGTPFTGSLDGKGHTIRGLTISIDGGQNIALFGVTGTSSVVENLTMENAAVSSMDWVATLVGTNNGTIWRCHATGTVNGSGSFGGLVGTNAGLIERSSSGVTVSGGNHLGGLAGVNAGTIRDCYSTGGVSGYENPGGLAGINAGLIENCYATGNVSTGFWWIPGYARGAGGLVGSSFSQPGAAGRISNCFSTGNVSGPDAAALGGLIGVNFVAPGDPIPIIENCYYNHIAGNPAVGLGQNPAGSTVGITAIGNNMSYFFTNANPPESAWNFASIWGFPNNTTGIAFPGFKNVRQVVVNGSFEENFMGWSVSGNLEIQSGPPYFPSDGSRLVSFNSGNSTPDGVLSQIVQTIPGQAYRLDFDAGVLAYNLNDQGLGVTVQGSNQLVSDTIILTGLGGGRIRWIPKSYVFTADSAVTTVIFRDLSPVTFSIDLLLDHVRVTPLVTTLLVTTVPSNGVGVTVSPPDTHGAGDGSTAFRRFYNPGALIDLTAPIEAVGGTFFNWLKDGEHYSTDPDIQVTMDGDHQMTAVYWSGDPMITVQPVSIEAVEGGTAVFSVTASGAVPLSYQWRFNGTDITGAEARELTISHVKAADAGNYDVVVSNSLGSVTSDIAVLSIQSGFVGLENGSFESDFQGWTVSGNVWIQSSLPYSPTDGIKLAAFNGGNTTPNAVLSQSFTTTPGQHYFLSFDMGVLSFNTSPQRLEVEVAGSPSLLLQTFPITGIGDGKCHWVTQNLAFTADSPRTTLTFRDRSFPPSNSIDMLLDHIEIVPRVIRTLTVESMATQSLPVAVSPADDNGDADGYTNFNRSYVGGTVVNLSALEKYYTSTYPSKGLEYRFQEWRKDGTAISSSPVVSVLLDSDHTLTAVYVEAPPVITSQPADVATSLGGSAWFHVECVPYGYGAFNSCQWRFNGVPIPGQVTNSLLIDPVGPEDAGNYDVMVFNSSGVSIISRTASLTIVTTPLVNGSFESGFDGWSHSGNVRVQSAATVPDGSKVLGFNTGNSAVGGVVSQTFTTIPGLTYRLTFDMGVLAYNTSEQRLQVNVSGGANLANQVFSMNGTGGGRTVWATKTVGFTTDSPTTTVTFTDRSPTSNAIDLLLDHVRLEPLSFTVTTLADENDGALGRGTGDSLREAIAAAAASPGVELIRFAPVLNGGTITLGGTQLTVDTDVMIDASSLPAGVSVSGNDLSRVFRTMFGRTVSMAGLTVTGGHIFEGDGGGILNEGTLNLKNVTVAGNQAYSAYWESSGGGIYNYEGILTIESSTVAQNKIWFGYGGGIANDGVLNLINSTVARNHVEDGGGGGIQNTQWGWTTLRHSTISDNFCWYDVEGAAGVSGIDIDLENSIIAGNWGLNFRPSDTDGNIHSSRGANLIGGDPMLAPLSNYGGRTLTMPPLAGSPAIDAAVPLGTSPATDQRGFPRIAGAAPDIGAVELQQRSVDTLVDEDDGVNVGNISLRDAVNAQATDPVELIRFTPNLNGGTIALANGAISSTHDLSIDGSSLPGGITISGNHASSVFLLESCSANFVGLTIADSADTAVRTTDCHLEFTDSILQGNFTPFFGAALTVWGQSSSAKILRCSFLNNGANCLVGAIESSGYLSIENSSFVGNGAAWGAGAIGGWGQTFITNSTFTGNTSEGLGNTLWLYTARIVHTTIVGNTSTLGGAGGIAADDPPGPDSGVTLINSIVAGNTSPDIQGELNSNSRHNLIGIDPMLAPLGSYGGRTQTMPPLAGSPAIDAAVSLGTTPATDQRGLLRISGTAPDMGAVESPDGYSLIPAGTFQMGDSFAEGSSYELPVHTVSVSAFYMGKHEVTKALWDEVKSWGEAYGYTDLPAGGGKAADHPVLGINWFAVVKWCNARSEKDGLTPCYTVSGAIYRTGSNAPDCNWSVNGYRLPAEAEWEKAARGGLSGKRYPWGDTISHSEANYFANGTAYGNLSGNVGFHPIYATVPGACTSPVGSFSANAYGLHDMSGNVWEWCWDWESGSSYYASSPGVDPRGGASGTNRIIRGGSWYDRAIGCRVAARGGFHPFAADYYFGFRVARSSVP